MDRSEQMLAECKTQEERDRMMYVIYKELTDRVEASLESLEYSLKEIREKDQMK